MGVEQIAQNMKIGAVAERMTTFLRQQADANEDVITEGARQFIDGTVPRVDFSRRTRGGAAMSAAEQKERNTRVIASLMKDREKEQLEGRSSPDRESRRIGVVGALIDQPLRAKCSRSSSWLIGVGICVAIGLLAWALL
jgi:hypothetical protein